jgi:hypothetical protein
MAKTGVKKKAKAAMKKAANIGNISWQLEKQRQPSMAEIGSYRK